MIYPYSEVHAVHMELTDRCNAACPMCPRFDKANGSLAPQVYKIQHTLEDIKKIFPINFIRQLRRINFCGNYGEPIVARDLLPIIAYLKQIHPLLRVEVNTNGSARKAAWWKALALVTGSDPRKSGVWFGLDGLEDTNHLYRRNTNWKVIMRNAKAFIDAGGVAHWNFIAFEHNEHQIEEARALAGKMGFREFNVKLTARFKRGDTFPVFVKGKHAYDLRPPTEAEHIRPDAKNHTRPRTTPVPTISPAMLGALKIIEEHKRNGSIPIESNTQLVPRPNIECIAQREKSIYISATGHVYPCCWISGGHATGDVDFSMAHDRIDITKRSIEDIVRGEEFQAIQDSWETGSISKCVHICTVVEMDADSKQKQHGNDFMIRKRADYEE